jgi:hypothetical protein
MATGVFMLKLGDLITSNRYMPTLGVVVEKTDENIKVFWFRFIVTSYAHCEIKPQGYLNELVYEMLRRGWWQIL